jgi:hypothetical protein
LAPLLPFNIAGGASLLKQKLLRLNCGVLTIKTISNEEE